MNENAVKREGLVKPFIVEPGVHRRITDEELEKLRDRQERNDGNAG